MKIVAKALQLPIFIHRCHVHCILQQPVNCGQEFRIKFCLSDHRKTGAHLTLFWKSENAKEAKNFISEYVMQQ